MTTPAEVAVTKTPIEVTVSDNTPELEITDNTPEITIVDNSTAIVTIIDSSPTVTITDSNTTLEMTVDVQPQVVVNTGAGTPYDEETLLAMLLGKLTADQLDATLTTDIAHLRDMWTQIGNELVLLYADGVNIETSSKTYTDTEISSSVAAIHVTITGEVDAKLSVINQTATEINQSVIDLEVDVDGQLVAQQSLITQNAASISSNVTRLTSLDGPTGQVTVNTSNISQNADNITLEVSARETLGTTVNENYAEVVLNTTDIGLQVSQVSDFETRMDSAEVTITATSIEQTVQSNTLGSIGYSMEAVESLLANRWAVNMTEDALGVTYSTGMQLMLHPIWVTGTAYTVDDTVFSDDEKVYICILGHTATVVNHPNGASGSTYWTEVVGGVKSEFIVQAEKFEVYIPGEASSIPVFSITGSTVRVNGTLLIDSLEALTAYIGLSIQSTNFVSGVSGWQLDKDGDFEIQGGTSVFGSATGVTQIDGGVIKADSAITIGNTVNGEYSILTDGELEFYYWDPAADNGIGGHEPYKAVKRIETGIAEDGDVIEIPGIFHTRPNLHISPNTLQIYEKDYPNQDQTLSCFAQSLEEYNIDTDIQEDGTEHWRFTLRSVLIAEATAAPGSQATPIISRPDFIFAYGTNYWNWATLYSSSYQSTPTNCESITVQGTAFSSKISSAYPLAPIAVGVRVYLEVYGVGAYLIGTWQGVPIQSNWLSTTGSFNAYTVSIPTGTYSYRFSVQGGAYIESTTPYYGYLAYSLQNLSATFQLSSGTQSPAGSLNWMAIGQ